MRALQFDLMQIPENQKQSRHCEKCQRCQVYFADATREIGTGPRLDGSTCGSSLPGIFIQKPGYSSTGTILRAGQIIVTWPGTKSSTNGAKERDRKQYPEHQKR